MTNITEYGDRGAKKVLIYLTTEDDEESVNNVLELIGKDTNESFCLAAYMIHDWNKELSPWPAPAVFGKEDFGDGAADTLKTILNYCTDTTKTYYIGGYSLAGLFALWSVYNTDIFKGVAAVSPSMWFPNFDTYMEEHEIKAGNVYLSLGDREEKTKNPIMATVGDKIKKAHTLLESKGVNCTFELNEGNHFKDVDIRTAKGYIWLINHQQ
ncbi:MAG: esterase [Lachnospiraceae bacterium]|nr:esterase [Lachnospiraceae bacterium]